MDLEEDNPYDNEYGDCPECEETLKDSDEECSSCGWEADGVD